MLTDLIIHNFAIVDRLHATFGSGFNVLTGETGAGKSIIIGAVALLLGGRARPDLIRTGEESATVEAMFDLSARPDLSRRLAEEGFGEAEELLVRRVISRSGKNRIFINGSLATLNQLQPLVAGLMTIYGQHEHQHLQRVETHLDLLDRYAGLEEDLARYRGHFQVADDLSERLRSLTDAERDRQQRLDLISFQAREIAAAALCPGEDEALASERLLLQNAERLALATSGGYDTLYGAEGAVCERLEATASTLEALAEVDPALGRLAETVRSSLYGLEDVAVQLRNHGDQVSFEPGRQNEVEERLALLGELKRKYAPTLGGVLEYQAAIEAEIAELSDVDAARRDLRHQLDAARQALNGAGKTLSARRREAASRLQAAVERELRDLALAKARFEVQFAPLEEPGPRGAERGEFFLAPNPGEEPKPLARIASGGELSRIMLALKRAAPEADAVATLVFDEVDAGIGGVAASAVGEKLRSVAGTRQVLCITHLPQVAAYAGRHFRVEKAERDGRTVVSLTSLGGEERVQEMARMLGGARVTERTVEHAREIIAQSVAG
ncbi:MAG: DNA repair protein RecN [Desulfuromonas sp.]|uniref:DNA repair protein RecN n=1 Tax=Desulfuromonas sp. TaxID=892 RepID=UPI000CC5295A|nr:DNA repair protein RecN [Desulfuromonas sp.]PLX81822.1 MAG: DNA repair protein RecN [Desulfuromonas sp.]